MITVAAKQSKFNTGVLDDENKRRLTRVFNGVMCIFVWGGFMRKGVEKWLGVQTFAAQCRTGVR